MGLLSSYALCCYGHKLNINNIVKMTNSIAVLSMVGVYLTGDLYDLVIWTESGMSLER